MFLNIKIKLSQGEKYFETLDAVVESVSHIKRSVILLQFSFNLLIIRNGNLSNNFHY